VDDTITALVAPGLPVIMISHSAAHAFQCGTHAALLERRSGFAVGPVDDVLTEAGLSDVYEIPVRIATVGQQRTCVPDPGTP
jgi:ABC-type cobalamin transport system ATPase subunit